MDKIRKVYPPSLRSGEVQCPAKMQKCTVKGCGETVRRKDRQMHQEENMSRHYSLLKEENERILWSASKMVSLPEMSIPKIHRYAPMKNFIERRHFNETS